VIGMGKLSSCLRATIVLCTALWFWGESATLAKSNPQRPARVNSQASEATHNLAKFDANRIACWVSNVGHIVTTDSTGKLGMEWPKGSGKGVDYVSGLWLVGKHGNEIRTACTSYGSDFAPGPILPDGKAADTADPRYRVYKINSDGSGDWHDWPFDLGAPAVMAADGSDSVDASGKKMPMLWGDQTLWWVMNDLDATNSNGYFWSKPMGIEIHATVFGMAAPAPWDDMMFVKWKIINKSNNDYDSCYVTLWDDPDVGDATSDLLGCDTTLNLAYCYNDGSDKVYGDKPPALGFVLLQGPLIPAPSAQGRAFGQWVENHENLNMTAFIGGG